MATDHTAVQASMDEALKGFVLEFRILIQHLKPDQVQAVGSLIDLLEKHTDSAGYKRTCLFKERPTLK